MAKWFGKEVENESDAGKQVEAKFTEFESTQKTVVETQTKQGEVLSTLADTIKQMNDREKAKELKMQKDSEAQQRQKQQETQNAKTPEMIAEELLNDPAAFIASQVAPATRLTLITHAKQMREEVLGDKEYYHGEFKKEVDALIESEPNLATRGMASFINNCYKVALGNHIDDIRENKLQKAISMHSFADGGNSGGAGDKDAKPTIDYRDPKTRFAASQMGLTEEDIINTAKSGAIHGLEVVA